MMNPKDSLLQLSFQIKILNHISMWLIWTVRASPNMIWRMERQGSLWELPGLDSRSILITMPA